MNNSMLIRGLAALAVCALLVPCAVNAKDKVERPLKAQADGTIVVSLSDASYQATESGRATHTGAFENEYSGDFDLNPVNFGFATGAGIVTAANGDQLFWELSGPNAGRWTGGTGRFAGATGAFTWVNTSMIVSGDSVSMTLTYSYTMSGTVTY